jgi:hypothetical protein
MIQPVLNQAHFEGVLGEAVQRCRHRLFVATANVKDLCMPSLSGGGGGGGGGGSGGGGARAGPARAGGGSSRQAPSILDVFDGLAGRNIEVRLLHGGVPSGPFLAQLKRHMPATLEMRRCPRVHAKAIIADGRWMYLGSANLTGAGLGARSARRRNFEAGIWTDQTDLIDPVLDMLEAIWEAVHCPKCGRKEYCPVPLEEPEL